MTKINVLGKKITILTVDKVDFISLTDMLKAKEGDFFISDWLRNRNTVEFLGIWEKIHNPNFNYGGYATIKSKAGLNNYKISVKEWVEKTNAIGMKATAGRYGGTYAHKDLAFEFGMWISAEFKIYLIKEFQRLKEQEKNQLGWDVKRILTKMNYKIHTDAIKYNLIPPMISKSDEIQIYASEADVLNVALFGMIGKEWREKNVHKKGNIRDYANMSQLVCLANLESLNSLLIKENIDQHNRLIKLNEVAISQMKILVGDKRIEKMERSKFLEIKETDITCIYGLGGII
ncbi:KilA-N domain-containing protein [Candidatus Woesearchaeota archaeon]|nr:KilA-N domain-containing protein [Candidatus Woesearchaeota archaeon]